MLVVDQCHADIGTAGYVKVHKVSLVPQVAQVPIPHAVEQLLVSMKPHKIGQTCLGVR